MNDKREVDMQKVVNIYAALQDAESRALFKNRLLYSVTKENEYISELVLKARYYRPADIIRNIYRKNVSQFVENTQNDLMKYIKKISKKEKIAICGMGCYGRKLLQDYHIRAGSNILFFDQDESRGNVYEKVTPDSADIFIITSPKHYEEIKETLLSKHIRDDKIVFVDMRRSFELLRTVYDIDFCCDELCELDTDMYFDSDIVVPYTDGRECFVDVGFCDGMTSRNFVKWCGGNYRKIVAFEPGARLCDTYKGDIPRLELHRAGAWSENGNIPTSTGIWGDTQCTYRGLKIDDVLCGEEATFIKMDIEGNELMALRGAAKTIVKWHPRLAISLYHKPEDIIELPAYILSLFSDYKLYIRHYNLNFAETVLYAVEESI